MTGPIETASALVLTIAFAVLLITIPTPRPKPVEPVAIAAPPSKVVECDGEKCVEIICKDKDCSVELPASLLQRTETIEQTLKSIKARTNRLEAQIDDRNAKK